MLGGHSPVLNWGLGMWSETVPVVLDHVPLQRSPGPPMLLLWGVRGVAGYSSCCAPFPAPKCQQEPVAFAMELEVLWLLGSLL